MFACCSSCQSAEKPAAVPVSQASSPKRNRLTVTSKATTDSQPASRASSKEDMTAEVKPRRKSEPPSPGSSPADARAAEDKAKPRRKTFNADHADVQMPDANVVEQLPPECTPEKIRAKKKFMTGDLVAKLSTPSQAFMGVTLQCGLLGTTSMNGNKPRIEREFEEKQFVVAGCGNASLAKSSLANLSIGASCAKGRKPEQPNQDNFFVVCSDPFVLCCVADGHGKDGHWASHWCACLLVHQVLEEISSHAAIPSDEKVSNIFDVTHKELCAAARSLGFDLQISGTTLSLVIVDRERKQLSMSWVGDSRCCVGRIGKRGRLDVVGESSDHKPNDSDERLRIVSNGGEVMLLPGDVPHRVFQKNSNLPGLAMSRAMGDLIGHAVGVIHMPGFLRLQFEKEDVLLCCSDGVWEFLDCRQALEIVMKFGRKKAAEAAKKLVEQAREKWLQESEDVTDDITAIVIWF